MEEVVVMTASRFYRIVFALAVLSILGPIQIASQTTLDLGGGIASPTGDLNELWNWGPGVTSTVMMEITPFVRGGFSAGFSRMGLDEDQLLKARKSPSGTSLNGGNISLFDLCAELRLQTGAMDKAVFFGGGGAGLFIAMMSDLTETYQNNPKTTKYENQNRFGGYLNAGFAIPLRDALKLGGKVQYNMYTVGGMGFPDLSNTRNFLHIQALVMLDI